MDASGALPTQLYVSIVLRFEGPTQNKVALLVVMDHNKMERQPFLIVLTL
jgi:hypothetical protein